MEGSPFHPCLSPHLLGEEMQVELSISNHLKNRARHARGFALRLSLSMSVMLIFCLSTVQAQNEVPGKPPSSEQSATTPTDKTRPRVVAETLDAKSDDVASESNPEQAAPDANEKANDRLNALRAQIKAAKTGNERMRLERMLIDYMVALGKKSEAVAELRVRSRADRLDPVAFYNIGNALARLGDTDTAIDAYRKAIKQRHGNYPRALNNLGVMYLRQGRWDEAQETLNSALKLEDFRYGEASYNLGRVYAARGETELAIREWSRAIMVEPDHADATIALARAYAESGNPERGLVVLDTFIARRGPSAETMNARREILSGSAESDKAKPAPKPTANNAISNP
jgi:tetratricopeptide (TPR) repeat protein